MARPTLIKKANRVDFRLPAPIYEKLEVLALEQDIKITQLVRNILTEYFRSK